MLFSVKIKRREIINSNSSRQNDPKPAQQNKKALALR